MKVLVACQFSGVVRDAFLRGGFCGEPHDRDRDNPGYAQCRALARQLGLTYHATNPIWRTEKA